MSTEHQTVLLDRAIEGLAVKDAGCYVDCTFGRGGHSRAILARLGDAGRLLVMDRDPQAIASAETLRQQDGRVLVAASAFSELSARVREQFGERGIDGVLLDLGVSSPQLDQPERGFSFLRDGPLDMRMDTRQGESAADWIARVTEKELADVLFRFGDERYSRRIAKAIVAARQTEKINSTLQLAEIIKRAHPAWEKDRHPATRSFQAIRIQCNAELEELESVLKQAVDLLVPGGRLVVISFHSLEDRMVKKVIAQQTKGDEYPRGVPVMASLLNPRLRRIGSAVKPDAQEIAVNPRARSAVMRVAEKLDS